MPVIYYDTVFFYEILQWDKFDGVKNRKKNNG